MSTFLTLKSLYEEGIPKKTIARRLGINVRTVRAWIRKLEAGAVKPSANLRSSKLDAHQARIEDLVERGCTAVQIHRELAGTDGFDASYETVKRMVSRLRPKVTACFERLDFVAGSEAQIDFGEVAAIEVDGRRRRRWLFCMTLCFSRYSYYEEVFDQKVPTFLAAIRRGFEYFGGVPERLKLDNLRSGVLINGLGERVYQSDFFEFCRHYGTVPDAARPYTPTDKGRVERDIRYCKGSHYQGRVSKSVEEEAHDLAVWRDEVANQRKHGTTRKKPADLFETESKVLRALPEEPFELASWGSYRVRKDCHVHVDGNYYSVPHRFVGAHVDIRLGESLVTAFAENAVVATHERVFDKGETVTDKSHYPKYKRTPSQEIHRQRVMKVRDAGPESAQFLARLREGPYVIRDQLLRMSRLIDEYGAPSVEQACRRALHFDAVDSAMRLQRILRLGLQDKPLPGDGARTQKGRDYGRPLAEYQSLLENGVSS